MSAILFRQAIVQAVLVAALALPAAAESAHHPPSESARPPAAQPAPEPPGPGGMTGNMMMVNMMQMMHRTMAAMMQDRGAMQRLGMMGMGGMGMMNQMAEDAIEHVEGHIAFVKAELKITPAQTRLWDDFAAAMRANAKQLGELRAELAKERTGEASPVDRLARHEKVLAARLEIARRTKPALIALHAALSDEQKKTFAEVASHRMGMR